MDQMCRQLTEVNELKVAMMAISCRIQNVSSASIIKLTDEVLVLINKLADQQNKSKYDTRLVIIKLNQITLSKSLVESSLYEEKLEQIVFDMVSYVESITKPALSLHCRIKMTGNLMKVIEYLKQMEDLKLLEKHFENYPTAREIFTPCENLLKFLLNISIKNWMKRRKSMTWDTRIQLITILQILQM
jgi:hypothetical protein